MKAINSYNSKTRTLLALATLIPAIVACAPTESAQCSRLIFQPHGSSAFNNSGPACSESRIYTYNPQLFEHQATWTESSKKVSTASDDEDGSKKKKSSI